MTSRKSTTTLAFNSVLPRRRILGISVYVSAFRMACQHSPWNIPLWRNALEGKEWREFDHITSHRQPRSIRKHCSQRAPKSVYSGEKNAINNRKQRKKACFSRWRAGGHKFESCIVHQEKSWNYNDFRTFCFVVEPLDFVKMKVYDKNTTVLIPEAYVKKKERQAILSLLSLP